jgi:hypothetical protein
VSVGSSPKPDIFISYSHLDRDLVARAVKTFESEGLTVWWDEKIHQIRWDREIEARLESCHRVVAFLTENAVSSRFDYIFSEMKHAREHDKLIPLRIGKYKMPFAYEGLVSLVQNYFFESLEDVTRSGDFARVRRACGCEVDDVAGPTPPDDPSLKVARWFEGGVTTELVAFALAVAFLEHGALAQIQRAANELTRILNAAVQPGRNGAADQPVASAANALFTPRSSRLHLAEAELYEEVHPRLGVSQECCRFRDAQRATALIAHVWREFDQLRPPLVQWLDQTVAGVSADGRVRIGLALGMLAQETFASVFEQVLRRWALDDREERKRDAADVALSVASFEPGAAKAARRILADWTQRSSTLRQLKTAVELSCGYTGMRLSGVAIETLDRVSGARAKDLELIVTMKTAIGNLLSATVETDDNSLLDLPQLIEDLAAWVGQPSDQSRPAREGDRLPMLLFLTTLGELPLTTPEGIPGVLSLADLMANAGTRAACARVLAAALRDPGDGALEPREEARALLRRWAERQEEARRDDDPVRVLLRVLIASSSDQRDKDRILHLIRHYYTAEHLLEAPET